MTPQAVLAEQFASFERSAWRLETRDSYYVAREQPSLRRFLTDGGLDLEFSASWFRDVRTATDAGKRYERVRVYTEPLTDYLRFEFAVAPMNIEAGEDIRVMSSGKAAALELPSYDFWLFDDERLAIMHFEPTGLVGVDVVDDPDTVSEHRAWRDLAWQHAELFETYNSPP